MFFYVQGPLQNVISKIKIKSILTFALLTELYS